MTDARTDFFKSGAKGAAPKGDARTAFFSSKPDPVAQKKANFSAPYAYFDPEVRREAGIVEPLAGAGPAAEKATIGFAAGVNRLPATILGFPGDVAAQAMDLGGAAYGATRSAITGEDPNDLYRVDYDHSRLPLTSDWFSRHLSDASESLIGERVTENPFPEDPGARLAFAAGVNAPAALIGGGPNAARSMIAGGAGGAAAAAGSELGLDPSAQVALSILGGHAANRIMESPMAPSQAREVQPETPQEALNRKASGQSMGAAGAAVDLQKLSPELRGAVEAAVQKTGGAVNPDVLARQVQADSLPVKVRLSEGQALGDERLISLELNARGKHEAYSKGFAEQNKALTENLRTMRDETGPDVFSTNPVEHADTLISRYQAIDDTARADISAKYKALEDANGGQFPVNGKAFVEAADAALAKKMKGRYLPSEVRGDLDDFRDKSGMMTFEQFENLRTNLATAARKADRAGDGNAEAAINLTREALEQLPIEGAAANLKPLADAARSAARARFDALRADPAYKAAVNESVTPDAFVQKFVVNGARDNVSKLSAAMADDPAAAQTLKVATLDHLRKAAGIDPNYNGNFTQAGYNKALQALEPKLQSLLDAKTAETARTLGDVARYTQMQPKGSFVNNSNTFVAAAAEKAADALEGVINYKTGGIPIASQVREALNKRKIEKAAEETFAPGAGLTKLSELTKLGKKKKP